MPPPKVSAFDDALHALAKSIDETGSFAGKELGGVVQDVRPQAADEFSVALDELLSLGNAEHVQPPKMSGAFGEADLRNLARHPPTAEAGNTLADRVTKRDVMGATATAGVGAAALGAAPSQAAPINEYIAPPTVPDALPQLNQSVGPSQLQVDEAKPLEVSGGGALLGGIDIAGHAIHEGIKTGANAVLSEGLATVGRVSPGAEYGLRSTLSPFMGSPEEQQARREKPSAAFGPNQDATRVEPGYLKEHVRGQQMLGEGKRQFGAGLESFTKGTVEANLPPGSEFEAPPLTPEQQSEVGEIGGMLFGEVAKLPIYSLIGGGSIGKVMAESALAEAVVSGEAGTGAVFGGAAHGVMEGVGALAKVTREKAVPWLRKTAKGTFAGKTVGFTPPEESASLARQLADSPFEDTVISNTKVLDRAAAGESAASRDALALDKRKFEVGVEGERTQPPAAADRTPAGIRPVEELPPEPVNEPSAYVLDVVDDKLVLKTVRIQQDGTSHVLKTELASPQLFQKRVNPKLAVMLTDEAKVHPRLQTTSWQRASFGKIDLPDAKPKLGAKFVEEPVGHYGDLLPEGMELRPDLMEGGQVVVAYGDGAVGIHNINSRAFQRESLKARGLVEVKVGSQFVHGYEVMGPSGPMLLAPELEEGLVRGAIENMPMPESGVRYITKDAELDVILEAAEEFRVEEAARAAAAKLKAMPEANIRTNPDGSPIELPPLEPPPDDGSAKKFTDMIDMPPVKVDPVNGGVPNPLQLLANDEQQRLIWNFVKKVPYGLKKSLLPAGSRGPAEAAQASLIAASMKAGAINEVANDTLKSLRHQFNIDALPKPVQTSLAADMHAFFTDNMGLKALEQKWPALGPANTQLLEEFKRGVQARHQKLVDLQMVDDIDPLKMFEIINDTAAPADARRAAEDALRTNVVKMFRRNMGNPGQWAAAVRKDAAKYGDFINRYEAEFVLKKNQVSTPATQREAQFRVDELMGAHDNPESLRQWAQGVAKDGSLHPLVKEIVGQSDNGLLVLAETVARQQTDIALGTMFEEMTQLPHAFISGQSVAANGMTPKLFADLEAGLWKAVPNDKKFGKLAGGYLDREFYDAVIDTRSMAEDASNFYIRTAKKLNGWSKFWQTVGNPATYMTQVQGNVAGMLMAGGNPFRLDRHIPNMVRDWKAYSTNVARLGAPGFSNVAAERFARARELFGAFGTFAKSELGMTKSFMRNIDFADSSTGLLDLMEAAKASLGSTYSIPDEAAKYIAWTQLLEKGGVDLGTGAIDLEKAQKFLGPQFGFSRGTMADLKSLIERESARRVQLSFPMLDRTSGFVRAQQQVGGLVTNPYAGIAWESLRTYMMFGHRLATGESGLRTHALKMAAVLGAAYGGIKAGQHLYAGMTERDIRRGWDNQPKAVAQFVPQAKVNNVLRPGPLATFVRDSQGRITYLDSQKLFEPLRFLQGDPDSPAIGRIVGNALMTPFDGAPVDPYARKLLQGLGLPVADGYSPPLKPWDMTAGAAGDAAMRSGIVPFGPAIERTANIWADKPANQQKAKPQLTTGEKALRTVGIPVYPASDGSEAARERRFERMHDVKEKKDLRYSKDKWKGVIQGTPTRQERNEQFRKNKGKKP